MCVFPLCIIRVKRLRQWSEDNVTLKPCFLKEKAGHFVWHRPAPTRSIFLPECSVFCGSIHWKRRRFQFHRDQADPVLLRRLVKCRQLIRDRCFETETLNNIAEIRPFVRSLSVANQPIGRIMNLWRRRVTNGGSPWILCRVDRTGCG